MICAHGGRAAYNHEESVCYVSNFEVGTFFYVPHVQVRLGSGERTHGLTSLSEKSSMSNHLQM